MPTASLRRGGNRGRFFFSSRRRHTRCSRDWSSDVCSSDLTLIEATNKKLAAEKEAERCSERLGLANRLVNGLASEKDRKSTRLNSSHGYISYAVFCLKKKKQKNEKINYF